MSSVTTFTQLPTQTYYENLKTRACAAVPSPAPVQGVAHALADEPLLHAVLARSMSTSAVLPTVNNSNNNSNTSGGRGTSADTQVRGARKPKRGTRRARTTSPPPSPALCLTAHTTTTTHKAASPEILGRNETPLEVPVPVPARTPAAVRASQQEATMLRSRVAALEAEREQARLKREKERASTVRTIEHVKTELQGLAEAVGRALRNLDQLGRAL